ncbi:MAG TPA: hypothetical protein VFZ93_10210 [Albitalea sp.]
MSSPPPERLPVLTEVVSPGTAPVAGTPAPAAETELVRRVLDNVQRQVDLMLEQRLREAVGPALARATEALARELREELASALRDVVSRAVAQELSRHRDR